MGARRLREEKPTQMRPFTAVELFAASHVPEPGTNQRVRDRAILIVGFAGAFRRSELSRLQLADVEFVEKGLLVHLRWTKTNQDGWGRDVGVFSGSRAATCPVRTLEAWITRRGSHAGPLFHPITKMDRIRKIVMGPEAMVKVVKRACVRIGLDPRYYAGHSLRAGYCTVAAENGATEFSIMQRTGHKTAAMAHRYVRPVSAFGLNPLAKVL